VLIVALGYEIEPPPGGCDSWNAFWPGTGVPDDELPASGDAAASAAAGRRGRREPRRLLGERLAAFDNAAVLTVVHALIGLSIVSMCSAPASGVAWVDTAHAPLRPASDVG
jgi:hypothetical protein